ncbi:pyridoxamine 5'-phosphate oxidase family protein [Candidatus Lokiarchaeum ossiferum]|uniref:pyridoxamine 5'-phosphate oxidase family protein n=1 Tax=Candidatus Lokiarchaeum ossiferum TaxID=2951803 RepID=UPI00352C9872
MNYSNIRPFFTSFPLIYLANCEGDQPHVRMVSLISYQEQLWFCSVNGRPKCEQLRKNNKVEFSLVAENEEAFHNIRAIGKALEIHDPSIREDLSIEIPFFQDYWSVSTDPNFVLYQLDLSQVEYHPPGGKEYFILNVKTDESERFIKNYRKKLQ